MLIHKCLNVRTAPFFFKTALSGDPLIKKVIAKLSQMLDEDVCFVAGTLVWTERGLVPIEQLKVGDRVLSKCDSTGVVAYKPVVQTFVTEDQEIVHVNMASNSIVDGKKVFHKDYFFMTASHPVWCVNRGWLSVVDARELLDEMRYFDDVRYEKEALTFARRNDEFCWMGEVLSVYQTPGEPNVGLITTRFDLAIDEGSCFSVVFDGQIDCYQTKSGDERINGATIQDGRHYTVMDYYQNEPDPNDYRTFRTTVYNIEVEDFHTYFVGELGLWVHNMCAPTAHGNAFPSSALSMNNAGQQLLPELSNYLHC